MHFVFINRCYWPDSEATGQLLTELCETLAEKHSVTVIAGHPNAAHLEAEEDYIPEGVQIRNGVEIVRIKHWSFAKRKSWVRLINLISFTRSATRALRKIHSPDLVICETDPFLLSISVARYSRRTKVPFVAYLQDIYPDVAVAIGMAKESAMIGRLRQGLLKAYREAAKVIVLSESMSKKIVGWGLAPSKVCVIPNWVDTELIRPLEGPNPYRETFGAGPEDCLIMHSGNMGATQPLDALLEAVEHREFPSNGKIAMVGGGVQETALKARFQQNLSERVGFFPYQPRARLAESLSAADIQVIASDPRVDGCLAPSKLYGILAAGRPSLVIGSSESDAARFVKSHGVGEISEPNAESIARGLSRLWQDVSGRTSMSLKARALAEGTFDKRIVIPQLRDCFEREAKAIE